MFRRWRIGFVGFVFLGVAAHAADGQNPLAGDVKAAKAGSMSSASTARCVTGWARTAEGAGPI